MFWKSKFQKGKLTCFIIFSTFVLQLSGLSLQDCVEPLLNNTSVWPHPVKFKRVSPNSKYLLPKDTIFLADSKDGVKICRSLGLVTAYADNLEDFRHIVNIAVKGNRLQKGKKGFSVLQAGYSSLSHEGKLGTYVNLRLNKAISFQMFNLAKNLYFSKGKDCLSIECKNNDCSYAPKVCKKLNETTDHVMPLCMYPEDSECFNQNNSQPESNDLFKLGETDDREYLGSKQQKGWKDAAMICQSNDLQLLSFIKNTSAETRSIRKFIDQYRSELKTFTYPWTGGRFTDEYGETHTFTFEDAPKEDWLFNDHLGHWEWIQKNLVLAPKEELCLAVVSTLPIVIRPLQCDLPNYFICYRRKNTQQQQGRGLLGGLLGSSKKSSPPPPPPPPPPPKAKIKPMPKPTAKKPQYSSCSSSSSSEEVTTIAPKTTTTTRKPHKKKITTIVPTTKKTTPPPESSSEEAPAPPISHITASKYRRKSNKQYTDSEEEERAARRALKKASRSTVKPKNPG